MFKDRKTFKMVHPNSLRHIKESELFQILSDRPLGLHTVSTMANFSFDDELLQRAVNNMNHLVRSKVNGINVRFEIVGGVQNSCSALKIMGENDGSVKYESILFTLTDDSENAKLPVLCTLTQSPQVKRIIHKAFESIFAARITPFVPSPIDIKWMTVICVYGIGHLDTFKMQFDTREKGRISFSVDHNAVTHWKEKYLNCSNHVLSRTEVDQFMEEVATTVHSLFGVEVRHLNCAGFWVGRNSLTNGRQLSIESPAMLYSVLAYFEADCC